MARPSNAGVGARVGIGRIDDDRAQPARIERRGQRQADQPAAQDDHVAFVPWRRVGVAARQGEASSRLTRESARKALWRQYFTGGYHGDRGPAGTEDATSSRTGATRWPIRCAASRAAARARCSSRVGVALAVALVTHSSVDPEPDHRRRRPADQLARRGRRLFQRRCCCCCSGPPRRCSCRWSRSPALRMLRGVDGRPARPRAAGRAAPGVAAARHCARPVRRVRGVGPARRLGRRARPGRGAMASMRLIALIGNPGVEGPLRLSLMALLAIAGLVARLSRARPPARGERGWASRRLRRDPDAIAAKPPRRSRERDAIDEDGAAAPPRSRPAVAVAEPAKPIAAAAALRKDARKGKAAAGPGEPRARRQLRAARRSTCSPRRAEPAQDPDRPRRARAQRAPARKRARGFPRPRRHRRGPPRPGGDDVRARAGERASRRAG